MPVSDDHDMQQSTVSLACCTFNDHYSSFNLFTSTSSHTFVLQCSWNDIKLYVKPSKFFSETSKDWFVRSWNLTRLFPTGGSLYTVFNNIRFCGISHVYIMLLCLCTNMCWYVCVCLDTGCWISHFVCLEKVLYRYSYYYQMSRTATNNWVISSS